MSSQKIDILNISLIFIALLIAFRLPFELFVFSYVVLGPLHYLTEINWLKEKNYFVNDRKWIWVFITLCLLISIPVLLSLPVINTVRDHVIIKKFSKGISNSFSEIILVMFLFAIPLFYFKTKRYIFLSFLGSIVLGFLVIKYVPFSFIMAGIFLPTIIHVYLFTLLFMIYGSLNANSKAGMIGSILLVLCPIIIFTVPIDSSYYDLSKSANVSYIVTRFSTLGSYMAHILSPFKTEKFSFLSEAGVRIQIFIAFSYTYHYLNWFSKTSVIGWSKPLSKLKVALIIILWVGSLFLYWYDYRTGYTALFFLSILHVVLEFPLNISSINGIVSKIRLPARAS